jgi:DNA modification methylase
MKGTASWYPYYAGFSREFVASVLSSSKLHASGVLLDPWNGSGTTSAVAAQLGISCRAFDLNPVMVVLAKARLLRSADSPSIRPLASEILSKASNSTFTPSTRDPLRRWFYPSSATAFRRIERSIVQLLVGSDARSYENPEVLVNQMSDLAAFFLIALFRTARRLSLPFSSSNPTWLKRPRKPAARLRPSPDGIRDIFTKEVDFMSGTIESRSETASADNPVSVCTASSTSLPMPNNSIDLVISSPPYCTRIDYAVSTSIELALLRCQADRYELLRRRLIGSATVPREAGEIHEHWGETCNKFLIQVLRHKSKASSTYYYKNHVQYFGLVYDSMREISRVLKPNGRCVLVVQDSYYKEIHNDLPQIVSDMAASVGLCLSDSTNFRLSRTLAGVNPGTRKYRQKFDATESVRCFTKDSFAHEFDNRLNVVDPVGQDTLGTTGQPPGHHLTWA